MLNKFIVLTGPTAVGKTDFSLFLAERIGGEIISADSMQVYKKLDIGTDKVCVQIRKRIPHHLIDILDPRENFSSVDFVKLADEALKKIRKRGKIPIVVGGTSFYLKFFLYGIPKTPPASPELRKELLRRNTQELFELLKKIDPEYAKKISPSDKKRIVRGIEIYELTGKPVSSFKIPEKPRYEFLGYFLFRNRDEIYKRIDDRIMRQLKLGVLGEAEWLMEYAPNSTASQAIGYKEYFNYLRGLESLETAVKRLKRRTRELAKRQFTWFRKEPNFKWVNLSEVSYKTLLDTIAKELGI